MDGIKRRVEKWVTQAELMSFPEEECVVVGEIGFGRHGHEVMEEADVRTITAFKVYCRLRRQRGRA